MNVSDELFSVSVLVNYVSADAAAAYEIVPFKILQQAQHFKAIPLLADNDRIRLGLPNVVSFGFVNGSIMPDVEVNSAQLEVMQNMIQELSILEVLDLYE